MTTDAHQHPDYLRVWLVLMALAVLSVVVSSLPIPAPLASLTIYGAALAKAVIVALYFMHLRTERVLVISLVVIPLALFFVLLVALLPDFVWV